MTKDIEKLRDKLAGGQKPDIPPRSSSLKICRRVTCDISIRTPSTPDKTVGNTFKQDSLKLPIPMPRYERYTQQDPLNGPTPTNVSTSPSNINYQI